MDIFETIYVLGFIAATILRSYYGARFKHTDIVASKKESPIVYVGMGMWGVALLLPFAAIFSNVIALADYEITSSLRVSGVFIFIGSLWVLWRSHFDLATNFSPSLFIRNNHTLVTTGIYKRIRHPMYLSFYMWAIGQALLIDNWLAGPLGILAFALIYLFRIDREEQQLIEQFGDEYVRYQRVTGRLLPKLVKK